MYRAPYSIWRRAPVGHYKSSVTSRPSHDMHASRSKAAACSDPKADIIGKPSLPSLSSRERFPCRARVELSLQYIPCSGQPVRLRPTVRTLPLRSQQDECSMSPKGRSYGRGGNFKAAEQPLQNEPAIPVQCQVQYSTLLYSV